MLTYETIDETIGKTFANKFEEVVIDSGYIVYTKRRLVEEVGVPNFLAAARLNKVLRRLKIHTVKELYNLGPFSLARVRGIGETSIFVAMCILDANNLSVEKWWGWEGNDVKFSAMRDHAIKRARKHKQDV